ncbi:MAG TPA: glycerate kinase [Patescibacteria group bacterium]|nr:glycerate kinase [Patescibacteria group bacterium]
MKIVIAPDSFKGSLSAKDVAENIKAGIERVYKDIDIHCIPMADGGEGTVQSLVDATGGRILSARVKGPLLQEVDAFYGILGDGKTAVIEMAAASGLPLVAEDQKNPMITTTYGTGELIKHALDMGCREIIIGIGGSATNDGGFGMAKALGVKFLDQEGKDIGHGGGSLSKLYKIDTTEMDRRIDACKITAACDVDNPLCGTRGATYIFGPQKGAKGEMLEILDKNLQHYAEIIKATLGIDIVNCPGAGAAGGLGGGLMAFMNVKLQKGVDIVIETVKLETYMKDADLVITGEGMMDYQTQYGKTPYGVAKTAKKYNIPVVALVGQIGRNADVLYEMGIDSIFSLVDGPMPLEEAIDRGADLLQDAAERIIRLYKIAHQI